MSLGEIWGKLIFKRNNKDSQPYKVKENLPLHFS